MKRREFIGSTLAATMLAGWSSADTPGKTPFPGMIVRMNQPRNLEFPVSELRDAIVPNDQFFVRSHFAVPDVAERTWKLKVEGAVDKPVELSYDDIAKWPVQKMTATIECAGNSRVHLTPAVPGLQWGQGAVGNAVWEGVSLAQLLQRAGVKKEAVEVVLEGADTGQINAEPRSPGSIHFARSLPLAKATSDQVVLAYKMNGTSLPKAHGFPLRAVVGGWYGMASVKWLTRIVVTDRPFAGFWQSLDYSYFERRDGAPTLVPVTAMQPKAIIAQPGLGEVINAGQPMRLFGAAWAGEQAVGKVEVSFDGGKAWSKAKLLAEPQPMQWVLWEFLWQKPVAGEVALVVRATDVNGATQPAVRDADRRSYMINHLVPTMVTVR